MASQGFNHKISKITVIMVEICGNNGFSESLMFVKPVQCISLEATE